MTTCLIFAVRRRCRNIVEQVDCLMVISALLITAMLATLSVLRYAGYSTHMFDLGNMAQAIWSSTRGRPLEFSYRGETLSRLALHVELVYFLLTPLYALFPSPITLLVVQALLFGAGSYPLYRLASRRIGNPKAARLVTFIYLLYPMAQQAVLFDFHGDTLAMPMLLFAIEALDRHAWRSYAVWILMALSCKVYVAAPVCALGAFLWLKGRRRLGGLTCVVGLAWGAIAFLVIRPLFAPPDATVQQASAVGYAQFYFGEAIDDLTRTWWLRIFVGLLVFLPVMPAIIYALDWGFLAFVVALPILLSSGPGPSYHFIHHHYAVVVPFLMLATVKAAERLATRNRTPISSAGAQVRPVSWRIALGATVLVTLLANIGMVDTPLSWAFRRRAFRNGSLGWAYKRTSRDALKDRWLAENVPDGVPVIASLMLSPHLVNRQELHTSVSLEPDYVPALEDLLDGVECVVLDSLFDYVEPTDEGALMGDVAYDWPALAAALAHPEFGLTSAQDGLLVLKLRAPGTTDAEWGEMTLMQSAVVRPNSEPTVTLATFADAIALVRAEATPLEGRRFRLEFDWVPLRPLASDPPYIAVSRLDSVQDARIVHLPTQVLHPTNTWEEGRLVRETFEVEIPQEVPPGRYPLVVGWYDTSHPYAAFTDQRSRLGKEAAVLVLEVVETAP